MPTVSERLFHLPRLLSLGKIDWLLGWRPGFGNGLRVLEVNRGSEMRSGIAWAIPALGCLLAFGLLFLFKFANSPDSSILGMMGRIFLFDYLLFLFGGLSGYAMARRWRGNPEHVEELSLAPMSPMVIGHSFVAGPISIWATCLAIFAVFDLLTPFSFLMSLELFAAQERDPAIRSVAFVILTLAFVLKCLVMAWFHYESVRLAHWMFVIHALPKVSLMRAGIINFITITFIVVILSMIGSAITGMMAIGGFLVLILVDAMGGMVALSLGEYYLIWFFVSLPGLIIVGCLKRLLCRSYESTFIRAWLLYQWWGAGERSQPKAYPRNFLQQVPIWMTWHTAQEEEIAGLPHHRRRAYRRYLRFSGSPRSAPGYTYPEPPGFKPKGSPQRSEGDGPQRDDVN